MTTLLLRNASRIYTCNDRSDVIERGYIYVEGNRISDIGSEPCPWSGADEMHDLDGCIVVPGFINLHHHFFQTVTRAVPLTQRASSIEWLYGMYPLWAEIDPEAMYWASLAAAAELLLSGATTSVDHSYLLPGGGGEMVDEELRAVRESGLRLHLVRGCLPTLEAGLRERLQPILGDRLTALIDREESLVPEMENDVRRYHDTSRFAMLRIALGPTGVTYEKPRIMKRVAAIAEEYGCGLHTHFHPRPMERDHARRCVDTTPLEFLRRSGWLRPGTWFAHGTQLNDEEIAAFAESGCGLAHCPKTIIRLGFPVARLSAIRRGGVNVGIGVDGAASNDAGSMLADLRLALLLHRIGSADDLSPSEDWLTPYDVLLMATRVAADILGRDDVGHLSTGMAADIGAFDLRRVAYAGGMADPLGALLMAGSDSNAALTVVNGTVVVARGALTKLNEEQIVAETNSAAERLLRQAEAHSGLKFRDYPRRGSGAS